MAENRKIIIEVVARTAGAEKNLNKVGTATEKTGQNAQKASKSFLVLKQKRQVKRLRKQVNHF
jgi:hypothetical protein